MSTTNIDYSNKKFLDEAGLSILWARITDLFASKASTYVPVGVAKYEDGTNKEAGISIVFNRLDDTTNTLELHIPNATNGTPGMMSPIDKHKLDELDTKFNENIKINTIKVGEKDKSVELLTDEYKNICWDFVYNSTTDTLDIIDNNQSDTTKKVLTSVYVNDFIGDALLSGFLSEAKVINTKDGSNEIGPFIKLTFTTTKNNETTVSEDIYINVADLIDIYTEGSGISIEQGTINDDKEQRKSVICLKTAGTDTDLDDHDHPKGIGGFVAHKVSNATAVETSSFENRYFGVEIGKDSKAIVNVPIGGILFDKNTTEQTGGGDNIDIAEGGKITFITGVDNNNISINEDGTHNIISLSEKTINISQETSISFADDNTTTINDLNFGDSINVITDIESTEDGTNGHKLQKTVNTIQLPTLEVLNSAVNPDADKISVDIGANYDEEPVEVNVVTGITISDNQEIVPLTTTYAFNVYVENIPEDTLNTMLVLPTDNN